MAPGARYHAHGGSGAILLVVGVQEENEVERLRDVVVRVVLVVRLGEHHVQEVLAVSEIALGVDERQTVFHSVRHGGDSAHFAEQERGGVVKMLQILLALVGDHVRIVAADGVQKGRENRHRVRGKREPSVEEVHHALVEARVAQDFLREIAHLLARGKIAVDYQVGGFDERGVGRYDLNGDTAVAELALFPVDVRDAALARTRVGEALVERDVPRSRAQCRYVHGLVAFGSADHGEIEALSV